MKIIWSIPILISLGCTNKGSIPNVQVPSSVTAKSKTIVKSQLITEINIDSTLGILSLNPEIEFSKKDTIKLKNDNGSIWYEFSFFYDDHDGEFDFYNPEFQPYSFHPDHFVLGLIVTGRGLNESYRVQVNMTESLEKYIDKEEYLIFRSWPDHILEAFSVFFDSKSNPVRREASILSNVVPIDSANLFHPVRIEGQWLEIKWNTEEEEQYGWIKWKSEGVLIINMSYSS